MEPEYRIRSIAEQILDELFARLEQEEHIAPEMIDGLRRLALKGKMTDSDEIIRVIQSCAGGES